jgi:Flp pilus assembly protein TadB
MSLVSVALGAVFGLGAGLLVMALVRTDPANARVEGRRSSAAPRFDRTGLRAAGALAGAVAIGVLTAWPVGIVLAGAAGWWAPSLLNGRQRQANAQARLDAIATWTEQLRDVMAAAAGLEQAIVATAAHAPSAIRDDIHALAGSIEAGTSVRTSLRRFADRLDDPSGDLVVAALVLAAEGSPRQVGDLLSRLAATTRDTVRMRLRVESGRSRIRSSVRIVTTVTVLFSVAIVVLNPTYVAAYRSPLGQTVLVGVAAFFAGAFWWLARAGHDAPVGRFLTGEAPVAPRRIHDGAAR